MYGDIKEGGVMGQVQDYINLFWVNDQVRPDYGLRTKTMVECKVTKPYQGWDALKFEFLYKDF